jgi:hypothetical protein
MKVLDLCSWLGAEFANLGNNSRSYCEDEQQRQGRKDKLLCSVDCDADH